MLEDTRDEWNKAKESDNPGLGWAMVTVGIIVGWLATVINFAGGGWFAAIIGWMFGALVTSFVYANIQARKNRSPKHLAQDTQDDE